MGLVWALGPLTLTGADAGALDASFAPPAFNGTIRALVVQPDGKVLAGGDFTQVGGAPRRGIARLNPDGSQDAPFNAAGGPDGNVAAIVVQPDGKILIGGGFTVVNGFSRRWVARLNTDGELDLNFSPGTASFVPRDDTRPGADFLALEGSGNVLVGGQFGFPGDPTRVGLARLRASGALDPSFATRLTQAYYSSFYLFFQFAGLAALPDGKVLISASQTFSIDETAPLPLQRLNADGSTDTTFTRAFPTGGNPNAPALSQIFAMAFLPLPDGKIMVSELDDYHTPSEVRRRGTNYFRLNPDGSTDAGFPSTPFLASLMVSQPDGSVIAARHPFRPTQPFPELARFARTGALDPTFRPNLQPATNVTALALQTNGLILVAGGFQTVDGVARPGLARLLSEGTGPGPFITNQPASLTVNPGDPAIFQVGVEGASLQYQWRFNGTNIVAATNQSLSFPSVSDAQLGSYDVVVSNPFGQATSAAATLRFPTGQNILANALDLPESANVVVWAGMQNLAPEPSSQTNYLRAQTVQTHDGQDAIEFGPGYRTPGGQTPYGLILAKLPSGEQGARLSFWWKTVYPGGIFVEIYTSTNRIPHVFSSAGGKWEPINVFLPPDPDQDYAHFRMGQWLGDPQKDVFYIDQMAVTPVAAGPVFAFSRRADGVTSARFQASTGRGYTVNLQASFDLLAWTTLSSSQPTNNVVELADPSAPQFPARYYRVLMNGN